MCDSLSTIRCPSRSKATIRSQGGRVVMDCSLSAYCTTRTATWADYDEWSKVSCTLRLIDVGHKGVFFLMMKKIQWNELRWNADCPYWWWRSQSLSWFSWHFIWTVVNTLWVVLLFLRRCSTTEISLHDKISKIWWWWRILLATGLANLAYCVYFDSLTVGTVHSGSERQLRRQKGPFRQFVSNGSVLWESNWLSPISADDLFWRDIWSEALRWYEAGNLW